jgi:hypothetical protein
VIALLVGGVACLVTFALIERRVAEPASKPDRTLSAPQSTPSLERSKHAN